MRQRPQDVFSTLRLRQEVKPTLLLLGHDEGFHHCLLMLRSADWLHQHLIGLTSGDQRPLAPTAALW